jgi:hypothetical protein
LFRRQADQQARNNQADQPKRAEPQSFCRFRQKSHAAPPKYLLVFTAGLHPTKLSIFDILIAVNR